MGPSTPRLCSAPRTNVVLPAPSSPDTSTTSPGLSSPASRAPARSVSSGPEVSSVRLTEAQAQGGAGAQQQDAGQPGHPGVDPGVGQRGPRGGGGSGRGGRGLRARRGRRRGRGRRGRCGGRGGGGPRGRGRGGLVAGERVGGLVVAGALGPGGRRGEGEAGAGHGEALPETRSERHRAHGSRRRERVAYDGSAHAAGARTACGGGRPMPVHILLLTDRDWTHPQGGGTGANLYGQVAHWLAWGHRVTVVAGSYK